MSEQIIFEIVNPSDPYTIVAPDLEIAAVACLALGRGQIGFKEVGGEREVPIFLFGGHDEWCQKQFGRDAEATIDYVIANRRHELADCLDSILIGNAADRASYEKAASMIDDPEKRREWRDHWHDKHRTSLNDIGGIARRHAAKLRNQAAKEGAE